MILIDFHWFVWFQLIFIVFYSFFYFFNSFNDSHVFSCILYTFCINSWFRMSHDLTARPPHDHRTCHRTRQVPHRTTTARPPHVPPHEGPWGMENQKNKWKRMFVSWICIILMFRMISHQHVSKHYKTNKKKQFSYKHIWFAQKSREYYENALVWMWFHVFASVSLEMQWNQIHL